MNFIYVYKIIKNNETVLKKRERRTLEKEVIGI